jgi:hypothetical protein
MTTAFGGLFVVLILVSVGMGVLSWVLSRARRRELQRLDEREAQLRREGKID